MKRRLFFLLALASFASTLPASPTPPPNPKETSAKHEVKRESQIVSGDIVQSANGWTYDKGEWIHPNGYKYVNGRILRTTARAGGSYPKPPGKLALQNPQKLTSTAVLAQENANKAAADKAAADKATERARNLTPRRAPQTGTNL